LVLALAIAIRSLQLPTPLALCFLSPWVDMTLEGSSLKERKSLDPWLDPDTIFPLVKLLLKGLSPRNQFASPLFAAMNGLPPAYIQVGTDEVLFSDSENLANRFDMFGNSVRFDIFENRFHVFQLFAPVNRDAAEATDKIVSFIQSFI
jgi:acetyl esterase/lipase